ncbi:MAG: M6 family metalloprotease domain-containing protein [bacterium]|nr:M6 family metalloprotease domain-containing protein [bacterium]
MRRFAQAPLILAAALACISLLASGAATAAPYYGARFDLGQPDGSTVPVLVWGDEYFQHIESLDGFTLVRDKATGVICYAVLAADGEALVSTGVRAGDAAVAGLGLEKHRRLPATARARQVQSARDQLDAELPKFAGKQAKALEPASTGNVQGITLIIDFSDQPATVPAANFTAYLNQPGYTGYGNHGSVRDYFHDVSDGALTYTNFVPTAYFRAPQPKSYYDSTALPYGQGARILIQAALVALNNSGFDFSQYDSNGDGYVDALNAFYAGEPSLGWSEGLWPHSSSIYYAADGVATNRYQITNIGSGLSLGTFCHENGHMLCFWPDLYDYDSDSSGVGRFCLMCNSGPSNNPVEPSAPLKDLAGWTSSMTVLTGISNALPVSAGVNQFYKVANPARANEYYMIENRQASGRDASLPDVGLAVWHVDTSGSNSNQDQTPASHYFCTLVQADGRWDLENHVGAGDNTDLWAAPTHVLLTPETSPAATWWSGADAPVYLDQIGASGPTMTFNYREAPGSLSVSIAIQPAGLPAPWRLEGPNGYLETGTGDAGLLVSDEGDYTLTWLPVPGWSSPAPSVVTATVSATGTPPAFVGVYTNPPFVTAGGGSVGDTGAGRGVTLVDVDNDGDLDIYICNRGSANRLLRNDGGLSFTDIATGLLADAGPTMSAAWADMDGDGDQDVYLTRDLQANFLLANDGTGVFTNIAQYGVEDAGAGRAAAWCDHDGDGLLDIFLVNNGTASQIFRSLGNIGFGVFTFFPQVIAALQTAGAGNAATWADSDGDGDQDVYRVMSWQANQMVLNAGGTAYFNSGLMANGSSGQAAAWGDLDNDGDLDLYLVNDGQADVCYLNEGAYFSTLEGPALGDAGPGRGLAMADLDNDGRLDIYVARFNAPDLLLFGDGAGGFTASYLPAVATGPTTSVACGDIDGDGGLDLYLSRDGQANVLLRNAIVSRGHWLHLDLAGKAPNLEAIGARVRVVAGGVSQLREVSAGGESLAQHARRVAFGLGASTVADSVIVRWPDGTRTVRVAVAADQVLSIAHGIVSAVDLPTAGPAVTVLHAPYPNPFNPATTVSFELAQAGPVELAVYALDGRRIATLLTGEFAAGHHQAVWQGQDDRGRAVASGSYVCRLQAGAQQMVRRLMLVK